MGKWPKRTKMYVHGDKESAWDAGKKLGLAGEALGRFRHALTEITVTVDVNQDGTYTIIETKE